MRGSAKPIAATAVLMFALAGPFAQAFGASGAAPAQDGQPEQGYFLVSQDGGVFTYGAAFFCGSAVGRSSSQTVGIAASGGDYWTAAANGYVYSPSCDPVQSGSPRALTLAAPISGIAPSGAGYWLAGADGGVFTYGDARFFGSAAGMHLRAPIVGITGTHDHGGYWLVGRDGGVFTFGDASYFGSTCYVPPTTGAGGGAMPGACPAGPPAVLAPIVGIAGTPDGKGYWLTDSNGGVYTFGDAQFYGSLGGTRLNAPIVGIAAAPPPENCGGVSTADVPRQGYWLVGADGGVFAFGDAQFLGSAANLHLAAPIRGITDGVQYACGAGPG